jgi:hypothetical protein
MLKSMNNLILDSLTVDSKINSMKLSNDIIIFLLHVKSRVFIKEISDKILYCIIHQINIIISHTCNIMIITTTRLLL